MAEALPKKSLGQHWLHDGAALTAICEAAEVSPADTVLEIGPGTGTLTSQLVQRAGKVIAVEQDRGLIELLKTEVIAKNLQIVHGDILSFNLASLPAGYKIAANIPYYLTSKLIRVLSESANPPDRAVLLVQKEVAERVTAQPGGMSVLAVSAQFYWQVSSGQVILAELFEPPPKVDSQILIMKRRAKPLFEDITAKQFFRAVKAGFSNRRKTLLNSLSSGLMVGKEETTKILRTAGVNPKSRPQELSLSEWHKITLFAARMEKL